MRHGVDTAQGRQNRRRNDPKNAKGPDLHSRSTFKRNLPQQAYHPQQAQTSPCGPRATIRAAGGGGGSGDGSGGVGGVYVGRRLAVSEFKAGDLVMRPYLTHENRLWMEFHLVVTAGKDEIVAKWLSVCPLEGYDFTTLPARLTALAGSEDMINRPYPRRDFRDGAAFDLEGLARAQAEAALFNGRLASAKDRAEAARQEVVVLQSESLKAIWNVLRKEPADATA